MVREVSGLQGCRVVVKFGITKLNNKQRFTEHVNFNGLILPLFEIIMDFLALEKNVRLCISMNKVAQAIELLNDSLQDDSDLNAIALQSATYHAIVEKNRQGTASNAEVDLAFGKLRSNILDLLQAKKEYLKYKALTFGSTADQADGHNEAITVFFSVGSPHNDKQQAYISHLTTYFSANGINLVTLKEWDENDPLIPIVQEMKKASGCLVLALERYYIREGVAKRGSQQESNIKEKTLTSPWLHIEAALARSFDLPLIILKEETLENEGLIHNDKQAWGIVRINPTNTTEIETYPIKNFILNWINQVKKYEREKNNN